MLLWGQLEPESGAELHTHSKEQAFFVLSGTLKAHIAGEEHIVEANSAVLIPSGVEHYFVAEGKEPAIFLGIYATPVDDYAKRPH